MSYFDWSEDYKKAYIKSLEDLRIYSRKEAELNFYALTLLELREIKAILEDISRRLVEST